MECSICNQSMKPNMTGHHIIMQECGGNEREESVGSYDTYGKQNVQLKTGPCTMEHYDVGAQVGIPDGIHIGLDGFAVVWKGILQHVYGFAIDKWGNIVEPKDFIEARNPVQQACQDFDKERMGSTPGS